MVPGHEIVRKATKIGNHMKKFYVGEFAAVGCIVDSCRECEHCKGRFEQFCEPGYTIVFGSPDKHCKDRPACIHFYFLFPNEQQKHLLCL
jgi:uncharacterized zinc-type alcohol dehydrogenase-like protein